MRLRAFVLLIPVLGTPGFSLMARGVPGGRRGESESRPDLREVMLVVRGALVELLLERPDPGFAVHPLEVAVPLVMPGRQVPEARAHGRVDAARAAERPGRRPRAPGGPRRAPCGSAR